MTEFSDVDLFGDEPFEPHEGRGRPKHRWSRKNSNKVLLAFVRGLTVKEAASGIGVAVSTLYEHYSEELKKRKAAAVRFELVQLDRLNEQAKAGNVAAEKELFKRMDKARLDELADRVAPNVRAPKTPVLGKKEQAQLDAADVGGRYETPAPPASLLN